MLTPNLPHKALGIGLKPFLETIPDVPFRLLGKPVRPQYVTATDTSVYVRELQPDRVFVYRPPRRKPSALLLECQMDPPSRSIMRDWNIKALSLEAVLQMEVILEVLYLRRGRYRTFPNHMLSRSEAGTNRHEFETACLWEQEERIRHGDLKILAPLLLLCEDTPEETGARVVEEALELLADLPLSPEQRTEGLGLTYLVGLRHLAPKILDPLFGGDMDRAKQSSTIRKWLREERADGRAEGRSSQAQQVMRTYLSTRFGDLPPTLEERIALSTADECDTLFMRVLRSGSLDELLQT